MPIVAVSLTLILGATLAAINFGIASSQKSAAQDALDAAALAAVARLSTGAADGAIKAEVIALLASAAPDDPALPQSTVVINRTAKTVTIDYASTANGTVATPLWGGVTKIYARAKAGLGATDIYPVCILITEPTDNHTLRASDGSKTDLRNCIVQVNTQNWDAVEAKDDAYIHIIGGQNCYVGDIHFGDIQPEKAPTCSLMPDPFTSLSGGIPNHCDYQDFAIDNKNPHSAPLQPGVYCGGITLEQDATFQPGVYFVKDGPLEVDGSQVDINAQGVTFVLCGEDAAVRIKKAGKLKFTPTTSGKYEGFVFFLDQSAATEPDSVSMFSEAVIDLSGVIYLNGQHMVIGKNTKMTVDQGTIVTGYLLPQGGDLDFTGALPSYSSAAAKLQKSAGGTAPVLME